MHTGIRRMGQRNCIYSALRQELMTEMFQRTAGNDESINHEADLSTQYFAMVGDKGKVTAKAHLLASIAAKPPTLLWGFSNILSRYGSAVKLAHNVHAYGLKHSEEELTADEVAYTLPDGADQAMVIAGVAHDIGSAAISIFGTEYYYYSLPIGGGSRVVLLLENLSEPVPPIVELMPGWSIEMNDDDNGVHHARVTDDTGTSIHVSYQFDEYERLKRLEFHHD